MRIIAEGSLCDLYSQMLIRWFLDTHAPIVASMLVVSTILAQCQYDAQFKKE